MTYSESFRPYLKVCRPESWLSWAFCFALGSIIFSLPSVERLLVTFVAFSFATSSIFVLNQYFDRECDKNNKIKADLPVASDAISPRRSLVFSITLGITCMAIICVMDIHLLPLFMVYLGLWAAYSAPIPFFKGVPVVDFVVSGFGAGLIPFYIGLGAASQLHVEALFAALVTIPLMLYHSGAHLIQTIGDYEPDLQAGIQTFAVRYGKRRAVVVAGSLFLAALVSPLVYMLLGWAQPVHLLLVIALLPLCVPLASRFKELYERPSENTVTGLQRTAENVGIFALVVFLLCILILRMIVP